ncbi:phage holin family protein, partial [Mycobacterium tuberculosis]|nr:phage holin family protein [Mycobacterium tuberculosis]
MSKADGKNGVPSTLTTIPLTDPHAEPAESSIGDLLKDATTQGATLVRAEAERARAEVSR